jgi:hypothetical protein
MQEQTNHLDDSTEGEIKLPDLPNVVTERVVKAPLIFTGAAYSLEMDKQRYYLFNTSYMASRNEAHQSSSYKRQRLRHDTTTFTKQQFKKSRNSRHVLNEQEFEAYFYSPSFVMDPWESLKATIMPSTFWMQEGEIHLES